MFSGGDKPRTHHQLREMGRRAPTPRLGWVEEPKPQSCKNPISDISPKDTASFSSQATALGARLMLHQPWGLCWETSSVRGSVLLKIQQEKAPAASSKAFLCTLEGLRMDMKVFEHPQGKEGGGLLE